MSAAWFPTEGGPVAPETLLVFGGIGLLLLVALLFALMLLSRRQQGREIRDLVVTLEELRSGRTRRRAEVDSRSSLAVVADATNRLAEDLSGRWAGAERAREQYHAFLEAARDYGVVSVDMDWDIRGFSEGAGELLGWTEEEVLGRPASLLFEEAAWKELLPKLARRTFRERGVTSRALLARRDGSRFEAEVLVRQLQGPGGEPASYLLVVKDLTAQARLEQQLVDAESRYRGLVEGLAEGVVILRDGLVVYANRAAGSILGASPAALEGRPLRERVATPDLLVVEEAVAAVAGREDRTREVRCALAGTDDAPGARVRLRAAGMRHEGHPATLVAVLDESTEWRAERELKRNEARLDALLEASRDGVVMLGESPAGRFVGITNRAFLTLFGLEETRVLGASESDFLGRLATSGEAGAAAARAMSAASPVPRAEVVTPPGEPDRALEIRVAPLAARDGSPLGRVVTCRDLSERKAAERGLEQQIEELRRTRDGLEESFRKLGELNRDLRQRAAHLVRLNRELRRLDEMKSNLLSSVSHELQTPLVSIRGYTEMILKERLGSITEEQRKGLTLSLKNIDRLIAMIDNLLSFARMDREAAEIRISTFPLGSVVDECIELLRERAAARRISVSRRLEEPEIAIRADRDKILQVFLNLLSNAVKFNRDGGTVEIVSRREESGGLVVQVRDTGVGIPQDSLERIFERFYQEGAAGEASGEGSGIGLAIVRNILRLHGCTIRAESVVGEGSTFSFTLPVAEGAADADVPEAAPAEEVPVSPEESPLAGGLDGSPRPRFRVIRHRDRSGFDP